MSYFPRRGIGLSITGNDKQVVVDASVAIDLFADRDRARVEVAEKIFMCFKVGSDRVEVFALLNNYLQE